MAKILMFTLGKLHISYMYILYGVTDSMFQIYKKALHIVQIRYNLLYADQLMQIPATIISKSPKKICVLIG